MSAPSQVSQYLKVFGALIVLLFVTVGAAYIHLGPLALPIAMVIACFKAWLVVMHFMHLSHAAKLIKLIAVGSFVWLLILMAGLLMDYWSLPVSRVHQDLTF